MSNPARQYRFAGPVLTPAATGTPNTHLCITSEHHGEASLILDDPAALARELLGDQPAPDLDRIAANAEAAANEVTRLCEGGQWKMTIPAETTDSDVTIGEALTEIDVLTREVRRLTTEQPQPAPGTYEVDDRPVDTTGYWQRLVLAELLDIPTDDDSLSDPDAGRWANAYGAACRASADLRHARKERDTAATERDKLRKAVVDHIDLAALRETIDDAVMEADDDLTVTALNSVMATIANALGRT